MAIQNLYFLSRHEKEIPIIITFYCNEYLSEKKFRTGLDFVHRELIRLLDHFRLLNVTNSCQLKVSERDG